ncbi:MAG: hypothetical protein A2Y38_08055 [Spirochaetes bacterium GWB1_59_5]|nr:MAG: hypothetical protein A2Y38_08055 [Spirochaetes bacterium GWB1_59_5]
MFHLVDLQGRFYEWDASGYPCIEQAGCQHVEVPKALAPLLGQQVKLLLAYTPDPASAAPGHGSCLWGRAEFCPVHRHDADCLLRFFEEGVLTEEAGDWFVGGRPVPFRWMAGHQGRLLGVSVVEAGDLRTSGVAETLMAEVEGQMQMMQSVLAQLRREP